MRRPRRQAWIGAALLAACPGVALAAGGSVAGVVKTAKKAGADLPITQDGTHCGKSVPDETLVVTGGKLANAVVWLEGVPQTGKPTPGKAALDQTGCRYVPHVQAVTARSKLQITNSDPVLHNVHAYGKGDKTTFNLAMPLQGQKIALPGKKLKKTGPVRIKCDAGHTWMSAWVYVFDHTFYAVSGKDGAFTIDGVPPGDYTLKVWHERLGTKDQKVTVPAGGAAKADFEI